MYGRKCKDCKYWKDEDGDGCGFCGLFPPDPELGKPFCSGEAGSCVEFIEKGKEMECGKCKWYRPEIMYTKGDSESWRKWGGCENPKLDIDGDIIRAGGQDGYGDYWHITAEFGCVLFEKKG